MTNQQQHIWYYMRTGLTAEVQEGPFNDQQMLQLAKQGKFKLNTKITSPTRTQGKWITVEHVSALATAVNQLKLDKAQAKVVEKQAKAERKLAAKQQPTEVPAEVAASNKHGHKSSITHSSQIVPPPKPQVPIQQTQVFIQQPQSNTIGMVGFVLSIASYFTCGIIFPLAILFSFIGMFFKPRAFAVAGFLISGGAALVLFICWGLFLGAFFATLFVSAAIVDELADPLKQPATLDQNDVVATAKWAASILEPLNQEMPGSNEIARNDAIKNEIVKLESETKQFIGTEVSWKMHCFVTESHVSLYSILGENGVFVLDDGAKNWPVLVIRDAPSQLDPSGANVFEEIKEDSLEFDIPKSISREKAALLTNQVVVTGRIKSFEVVRYMSDQSYRDRFILFAIIENVSLATPIPE